MKTLFRTCRASVALLAIGLCAALGFAQSSKPTPPASAQTAKATPAKKLDDIVARFEKADKEWRAAREAAKTEEEGDALDEKRPGSTFLDELEAVAKEAKGTETGAKAWLKYATIANSTGSPKQAATAVEALVDGYVTSPLLAGVPDMMGSLKAAKAEELLRRLVEKATDKKVQAASLFALGSKLMDEKKPTPERTAEGRAMLEKLQKEYVGIKSPRGPEYAAIACGKLFELDNLQIGKAPADFETVDENGVKFKLSDYRGKVVVLDFWGNW